MRKTLALLFVLTLSACQGDHEVVSNLTESEANEILVVFNSQKISATKTLVPVKGSNKAPGFTITVKASDAPEALRILVDNHLPKVKSPGLGDVYPADASSLIPSRSEERAKFLRALQGEVENVLKILPGVVDARVIIVVPDQDIIRDLHNNIPHATASVAVVYNAIDAQGTPPVKPEGIKYLVASAVENLSSHDVTVLMSQNFAAMLAGTQQRTVKKSEAVEVPKSKGQSTGMTSADPFMWLFGALGIFGVLLGIFGIIRNRSLRYQLAKVLEAHADTHANTSTTDNQPGA